MEKKEQGILTVEASLVMGTLVLVILFIFSFARLYRAQSVISHAILQASDAVAMESYLRETVFEGDPAEIVHLANKIGSTTTVSADSFTSLRDESVLPKVAKQKFTSALSDSESGARQILDNIGIKGNVEGIDFSKSYIDLDNNDVIIYADYTIKMQFPVFGFSEFKVSKAAKAKTFGEILFEIKTMSEEKSKGEIEYKGTALGGGNYKHGTKIQISAEPHYGYKFVSWNDGNTENPRTVTVAGAATYIAKFTEDQFGVTTKSSPGEGGTTSGAGLYNYLSNATVTATPNAGYSFDKWVIYSDKDKTSKVVKSATHTLNINQRYLCMAYFNINNYTVSVKTEGLSSSDAKILYKNSQNIIKSTKSLNANYKYPFTISASDIKGYTFLGWKIEGEKNYLTTSKSKNLNIPAKNTTYIACYAINNYNISVSTDGSQGCTVSGSGNYSYNSTATITATAGSGYKFSHWELNGKKTDLGQNFNITVDKNVNYRAVFKVDRYYTVTIYGGDTATYKNNILLTVNVPAGSKMYIDSDNTITFSSNNKSVKKLGKNNGHKFNGWYSKVYSTGTKFNSVVTINEDEQVYAHWKCGNGSHLFDATCGETHIRHNINSFNMPCEVETKKHSWNFQCIVCRYCGALCGESTKSKYSGFENRKVKLAGVKKTLKSSGVVWCVVHMKDDHIVQKIDHKYE